MKKLLVVTVVLSLLLASVSSTLVSNGWAVADTTDVSFVRTFVGENGRQIDELVFPGKPPQVSHTAAVSVPEPNMEMGANSLSNVPAFDWSYGCSPTSAAMLFGFYDRTGYNSMYTGPTNGGMCPLDNSVWGGSECPLSATHQGIDGQTERAHVGDYWINYGHNGPDPYIVDGLPEHIYYACTADFMGTSQSKFGNPDGCTTFYCSTNGDPLYDYTGSEPLARDGCHGLRLFAESRGYTVLENYSQYIRGQGSDPNRGFTFEEFMVEIDAGRPVLIHVVGHTMLGYGYNTTGNIVYIHNTWDHSAHQMTWGGTFSGLQHKMVTVIRLAGGTPPQTPPLVTTHDAVNISQTSASLVGSLQDMGTAETVAVSFRWGTSPGSYSNETIPETLSTTAVFDAHLTDLQPNTTYYFRAKAVGDGTNYGSERQFTTCEETPAEPPLVITGDAVNISQTSASLVGSLQDMGTAETIAVSFRWGTSPGSYPNETIPETLSTTAVFDAHLTDLQANTTYYFRAKAVGDGTSYGLDKSFITSQVGGVVGSIEPSSQTVPAGGSFSIDVEVDSGGIPITTCNVTVTFDPHLTATLLTGADLLGTAGLDALYLPAIDVGEVSYGGVRIDDPIAVNGDFVTIDFNVDPAATGTYALVVATTLMDSNGDPIAMVDSDGQVNIGTIGRKGDFDRDGDIDFFDFVQFADAYGSEAGDPNYNAIGDFNDDGYIDFFDFINFADVYGS